MSSFFKIFCESWLCFPVVIAVWLMFFAEMLPAFGSDLGKRAIGRPTEAQKGCGFRFL